MAFDPSTAIEYKDLQGTDAGASNPSVASDVMNQQPSSDATASAPSPGGFDPNSAIPLENNTSVTHLADKGMDIEHPTDMPDHQIIGAIRDHVYGNDQVPGVPEEGQKHFMSALVDKLSEGYSKGISSIAHLLGVDKTAFMQNILLNKQEFAELDKGTQTQNPYKQFGYHFAEGVGGLLSTLPIDIVTGGATKGFLLANVGARTASILKFIPGFAIGAGMRGAVQGAEVGASEGPAKAVEQAAQQGTENLVWGTLYGNAGPGISAFPKMIALGAGQATYEAAKQNRLPTTKELYTGAAEGLAYASVFAVLPFMAGRSENPVEKQALSDTSQQATDAAHSGDIEKADGVYQDLLNNEAVRPELRDAAKQIYDETRTENLAQVQDMTKQSQGALKDMQAADNIVRDETGKPIEVGDIKNAPVEEGATAPKEPKASKLSSEAGNIDVTTIPGVEKVAEGVENVKDFLERSAKASPISKDVATDLNTLKSQNKADEIRAVQFLKKVDMTPEDAAAVYKYADNMEVFGDPKDATLTEAQQKIYDENLKPLQEASDVIFSKLRDNGMSINQDGHLPRFVEGKGNVFDRLQAGIKSIGQGGLLTKAIGSMKKRVMNVLEDEEGNRTVVAIKKGDVTAFRNGQREDLGKVNIKSYEQLRDADLEPIDAQREKLDQEYGTLTKSGRRIEAASVRIRNIESELVDLDKQEQTINDKYENKNMTDKVFVDKNGKIWNVGNATTAEIEANTNLTYHKNPVLNVLANYLRLRQVERATEFLEGFKSSPDFKNIAMEFGKGNVIPEGWRGVNMPQFRGYSFEPRVADTLDSFYNKMQSGDDPVQVLGAINSFLRNAIFFNPAIHIPNISVHWAVNRGLVKWFMPAEYKTLMNTATRAIEAVRTQNADYVQMLDKGANLLYADVAGDKISDLMMKKMGEEISSNEPLRDNIAKALGYVNPANLVKAIYDFSGRATWSVNDVATMQAVYEEMEHGKSMEDAIQEVGKHIPNYRMPARILDSKAIANIMQDRNITMFGAYHYGALKSYGELIKSLVDFKSDPKEGAASFDKLAMMGVIGLVVYPALDNVARALTGNPDAQLRRAGATTFPYNTYQFLKGKMDLPTYLFSIATPAPLLKAGVELTLNRNLFNGKPIYSRDHMLQDLGKYAANQISPVAQAERLKSGQQSPTEAALGLVGIKSPHHVAHTDAEQEAMNIMHTKNFGGGEMTDEQRQKYVLKQNLTAGYVKTKSTAELSQAVISGEITKREMKSIIKSADMAPIVRMTKQMSVEEVQKVLGSANAEEKKLLIPVLQKKIENRIKLVPAQQKDALRKLRASLTAQ